MSTLLGLEYLEVNDRTHHSHPHGDHAHKDHAHHEPAGNLQHDDHHPAFHHDDNKEITQPTTLHTNSFTV